MKSSNLFSLTRSLPVLSVLVVAGILFAGPLAMAQQTATTPTLTQEEQEDQQMIQNTMAITTQFLEEGDKQIGPIVFTPRWSGVSWIDPGQKGVIFADCLPGEFAISGQEILGGPELAVLQSFAVGLPEDFMVWVLIVENQHETDRLPGAAGVICASDEDVDETYPASTIILQPEVKQRINNVIKQFITVENNQITNINAILYTYQNIVQNAINIAINSTNVTQINNQEATQIANNAINNVLSNSGNAALAPPPAEETTEGTTEETATSPEEQDTPLSDPDAEETTIPSGNGTTTGAFIIEESVTEEEPLADESPANDTAVTTPTVEETTEVEEEVVEEEEEAAPAEETTTEPTDETE
ncbi:MAG: hypothetical protein M3115_05585 [Thermoproteota archaeon]|nr:hypothetical protein [Thermoproteota archaeon]